MSLLNKTHTLVVLVVIPLIELPVLIIVSQVLLQFRGKMTDA